MSNRQQLLTEYSEWIEQVKELAEQGEGLWNTAIAEGKWTVRDVVCHIMRWDEYFFKEAIAKISQGDTLTVKHLDYDTFNEEARHEAKICPTDVLIARTIAAREKLIHTIEALPDELYERRYTDGDGHPFEVEQFMRDFIWHDKHHLAQLNDVRQAI